MRLERWCLQQNCPIKERPSRKDWTSAVVYEEADTIDTPAIESRVSKIDATRRKEDLFPLHA